VGSGGGPDGIVVLVVVLEGLVVTVVGTVLVEVVGTVLDVTTGLVVVVEAGAVVEVVAGIVVVVTAGVVVVVALDVHAQSTHTSGGVQSVLLSHCSPLPASRTPSPQVDRRATNIRLSRLFFPTTFPESVWQFGAMMPFSSMWPRSGGQEDQCALTRVPCLPGRSRIAIGEQRSTIATWFDPTKTASTRVPSPTRVTSGSPVTR
jgi:hypothetical protein